MTASARANLPSTNMPSNSSPHPEATSKPSTGRSQQDQTATRSHLVALPTEVLNMILRHLLVSRGPLSQVTKGRKKPEQRSLNEKMFGDWLYSRNESVNLHPQILQVCHHPYKSGWQILYKDNTWLFHICHTRYVNLMYAAAGPGRRQTYSDGPFNNMYATPRLTAAAANMEKFSFDVQLKNLEYKAPIITQKYLPQPSKSLRDILTGSNKEVVFNIRLPHLDRGQSALKLGDRYVTSLTNPLHVFNGVRCRTVRVYVDGVQVNSELAEVMMSDDPVDESLRKRFEDYEAFIAQFEDRAGFPGYSHEEVRCAVDEWNVGEFEKLSEQVLDVVDKMLQEEREDFNTFKGRLQRSRSG